jgi:hypothetical protein
MWRLEVRCRCTSGGPVLSDCIAHPSIWSSRSVNWGETVVLPPAEVGAVSDMVLVFVGKCVCVYSCDLVCSRCRKDAQR